MRTLLLPKTGAVKKDIVCGKRSRWVHFRHNITLCCGVGWGATNGISAAHSVSSKVVWVGADGVAMDDIGCILITLGLREVVTIVIDNL
jgi:hypothetical protein